MVRKIIAVVVAMSIAILGGLSGTVAAQAPPVVPESGDAVVGLYLAGSALGGVMSPEPPTAATSTKKSMIAAAINPGVGTTVVLGSFTPAADMTFISDVSAVIWVVAETAMVFDQVQLRIVGTGLTSATANTPLTAPITVQTTPVAVRLGIPAAAQTVKAGTKVSFEAVLFGVSAAGTPTDVSVLFGSKTHSSGIGFSTTAADAFPVSNSARMAYLWDKSLTLETPTATADKSATIAGSACTGTCMGTVPAWTWGKTTVADGFTVSGESVLTLWLSVPAGAMRGFTATLTLGKNSAVSANQGSPIARSWSAQTVSKFIFVFPTRGLEVEPGTDITVGFQAWTTADTPAGDMKILYGSVARPSGVMIPTAGSAASALPSVLLQTESTEVSGPAGANASATLQLLNNGSSPANVTLNASGPLAATFDAPNGTVSVANATLVNVTFDLSAAAAGETHNMTIFALIDGIEVANLTLTVTVTPAVDQGPGGSGPGTNATASSNATANAKSNGGGVPGPSVPLFVAALVVAIAVLRRRRQG